MKRLGRAYLWLLVSALIISTPAAGATRKIGVMGTGYVGLVLGTCLAEFGHDVICADIDSKKIAMLNKGQIPIYEPGLKEMVPRLVEQGRLKFSDDPAQVIQDTDVIFIAVGTPMSDDGRANLSAVKAVARTIGENLNDYKLICTKSTVPIGTGVEIKNIIRNYAPEDSEFDIVSNPEFLKEGTAIDDFMNPERVVIGCQTTCAEDIMEDIYRPLYERGVPFVYTDLPTAETIKYACNAFLAVKISFINEMANLCDMTGADVLGVAKGMGLDSRIGHKFLRPGPGFGGSCFPKDVQALLYRAQSSGIDLRVVNAALNANLAQKEWVFKKFKRLMGNDLVGKKIAVLGLAFKANTDDVRYSPAITFIERILEAGAYVRAYDPIAIHTMKEVFPHIEYGNSIYDTVKDADAVAILTEWNEFRMLDLAKVKELLNEPVLLDARNLLNVADLEAHGFTYDNIGNAQVA